MSRLEDEPAKEHGIAVPKWIDQDITIGEIEAIMQGGCASGAYMPAVTYHSALKTMSQYGDEIMEYTEDSLVGLIRPEEGLSWSGMACHYLSVAVELWAVSHEITIDELKESVDD